VRNLYSITTNKEAIRALFLVVNRYVGNLAPMPGVFRDYPAPGDRQHRHGHALQSEETEHKIQLRDFRHPAACASASEQNHRSP